MGKEERDPREGNRSPRSIINDGTAGISNRIAPSKIATFPGKTSSVDVSGDGEKSRAFRPTRITTNREAERKREREREGKLLNCQHPVRGVARLVDKSGKVHEPTFPRDEVVGGRRDERR